MAVSASIAGPAHQPDACLHQHRLEHLVLRRRGQARVVAIIATMPPLDAQHVAFDGDEVKDPAIASSTSFEARRKCRGVVVIDEPEVVALVVDDGALPALGVLTLKAIERQPLDDLAQAAHAERRHDEVDDPIGATPTELRVPRLTAHAATVAKVEGGSQPCQPDAPFLLHIPLEAWTSVSSKKASPTRFAITMGQSGATKRLAPKDLSINQTSEADAENGTGRSMTNNDILRRIRYVFDFSDDKMIAIFALANRTATRAEISDWLKKDDDPAFNACADLELATFLNGLILEKRGKLDGPARAPEEHLTHNIILTKLRIALALKADEMIEIFGLAEFKLSKHELTALFRRIDHKHYRECQDQLLRNFLRGMQLKYRPQ